MTTPTLETPMDADRIEELKSDADQFAADEMHNGDTQNTLYAYRKVRDAHFARLVERDALERAKATCLAGVDGTHKAYAEACYSCAALIDALLTAADTAAVKERVRRGMESTEGEKP